MVTPPSSTARSAQSSPRRSAKPGRASQRSTDSMRRGRLLGVHVGQETPARFVRQGGEAVEEAGERGPLGLVDLRQVSAPGKQRRCCGARVQATPRRCRTRWRRRRGWQPAVPRSAPRRIRSARARRDHAHAPGRRTERPASAGARCPRGPAPARPCVRTRFRGRALQPARRARVHRAVRARSARVILDRQADRVAHPQQVVAPQQRGDLVQRLPALGADAVPRTTRGRSGCRRPGPGPARCLGLRSVGMRATVAHGPSDPRAARSMMRSLRTPSRNRPKAAVWPHMPAPTTSASSSGAPSGPSRVGTQSAAG